MKWTLYLDLDETILFHGNPVHNTASFFQWCINNFDVKWMTRWCPDGKMSPDQINYLSQHLGVPKEEFPRFNNPNGFRHAKPEAIDWSSNKPWVWVENSLNEQFPEDYHMMERRVKLGADPWKYFYETNLHHFPESIHANGPENAIYRTWVKLCTDFKLKRPLESLSPKDKVDLEKTGMFWELYPETSL